MTGERSEYTGREVVAEIPSVDVFTSDQDKIGRVLEIGPEWIIVDREGLFSGKLWIPASRVTGDPQQGAMYVDVARDQLDEMSWDHEPDTADTADSGTYASTDTSYAETSTSRSGLTDTRDTDTDRIRVHEEELQAKKVSQESGAVNVRKDVVEEQRQLDVPVMREEVEVTRHAVSGDVSPDDTAFRETGDTIRVPIVEERVEVRKVPRVVEEVEISKRAVQDTQRVSDTVRREEVHVDEEGTGTRTSGTTGTADSYDSTSGSTGTVSENRQKLDR